MTNEKIMSIALNQSATDFGYKAEEFLSSENKIFLSKKVEKARASEIFDELNK